MALKPNPIDISDADIEQMYRDMWGFAEGNYQKKMAADLLTAEMNRRLVVETTADSARWAKFSLGISLLALVIAGVSAGFAYTDWKGDLEWQNQQIQEIMRLGSNIEQLSTSNRQAISKLADRIESSVANLLVPVHNLKTEAVHVDNTEEETPPVLNKAIQPTQKSGG